MPGTLIVNARLVNEGHEFDGDLRFANGRITHVGGQLSAQPGDQVIEAGGRWLLPGMIDDQLHFREPGLTHKGDIASESGAAAAGGLTTFMDMPNTTPPTLDAEALQAKYQSAAGRAWGNFGFYLGASNDNLEAVRTLDPKTAPGIKGFLWTGKGGRAFQAPDRARPGGRDGSGRPASPPANCPSADRSGRWPASHIPSCWAQNGSAVPAMD